MPTAASLVRKQIDKLDPGSVFGYTEFSSKNIDQNALAMTLSRLSSEGAIVRLAKGKYYKPEESRFGRLRPRESAVVEAMTTRNGKKFGYLTGLSVYNRLGLSSQVSNVLEIATCKQLPSRDIEGYKIKYQIRNLPIKGIDIPLLQLLDAVKDIKRIPDASPNDVLKVLMKRVRDLSAKERSRLVSLASYYNPATRALVGAVLEQIGSDLSLKSIRSSLNGLTKYNIGIDLQLLPTKANWNIL